jgi:hypothetical protein
MKYQFSEEAQAKKKCCEQSFLGSIVGLQKDDAKEVSPFRRALGLFILAGVHAYLLIWSSLVSIFVPRYRRLLGFQIKYFRDVIVGELKKNKQPGSSNP